MNKNKLSKEAHEYAVSKGFWDSKKGNEHNLMLIVTEIAELVEADRQDRNAEPIERFKWFDDWDSGSKSIDKANFKSYFKDTIEDEMADIAIRIADLAGYLGVDFEKMYPCRYYRAFDRFTFSENAFALVKGLAKDRIGIEKRLLFGLTYIENWAKHQGVDLDWHIEQKMKFNKHRETMHGKKY